MIYRINDLCEVKRGSSPRPIIEFLSATGYKWLKISDFAFRDRFVYNTKEFIKEEGLKGTRLVEKGTLILTNSATPGIPIFLGEDMCLHDGFLYFPEIDDKVDQYYLFYWFQNFRSSIVNQANGSVFKNLKKEIVENLEIDLPEKVYQSKVVKILDSIDKKIELNNQINNNLSELALTLFKEFIEQNKDSSEKIDLKDCVEKIGTGADAIQRAPIVDYDTGIRCIRVGDMTNNRKYYEWGFTEMTDKDFENYKLDLGDIVVTRTAVNGITKIIDDNERIVCNNGLIRLKMNSKYNPMYIYMCTKTKDFYDYIHRIDSETSVRPNMKVDYFTSYQIDKISLEKQNEFCNKIDPLLKLQKELEQEIHNLEQLRDTLLPKLMNGEIDLDNIEI